MRKDLTTGQQLAQTSHAITEFCLQAPDKAKAWYATSNTVCILGVSSEEELLSLITEASSTSIEVWPFFEPDLENALTAAVFEPTLSSRKLLRSLKLA